MHHRGNKIRQMKHRWRLTTLNRALEAVVGYPIIPGKHRAATECRRIPPLHLPHAMMVTQMKHQWCLTMADRAVEAAARHPVILGTHTAAAEGGRIPLLHLPLAMTITIQKGDRLPPLHLLPLAIPTMIILPKNQPTALEDIHTWKVTTISMTIL